MFSWTETIPDFSADSVSGTVTGYLRNARPKGIIQNSIAQEHSMTKAECPLARPVSCEFPTRRKHDECQCTRLNG